ncbi:glutathione S-transferase family protein [Dactylosporangium sp. NPDC051541]|uniref:glutathione S-transferase family protein n=1 Tax=Dactylosporangium sp. NPDC051541 TaxID=3363977 RepID=UPI0037B6E96F
MTTAETSARGAFVRQPNRFTGRVTAESAAGPGEGPDDQGRWPLEPGRYRLVWSRACPWAHRAVIVRGLLGLQDAISLATVDPIRDERGWRFTLDDGGRDPVLGIGFLAEAYAATDPAYAGRVTVPSLVDTVTGHVVTNDYPQLTLDLSADWAPLATRDPGLLPADLRPELDQLMQDIFEDVNNGVYRCGFATTQEAYDEAYERLFARLDALEARLADRRFLFGDRITEADVRLFTTLVRFDTVYHGHFKCNRNKLAEMPHLWRYARELYNTPGFGETVDFDQIKRHYYGTHANLNPSGVVPKGPDLSAWTA